MMEINFPSSTALNVLPGRCLPTVIAESDVRPLFDKDGAIAEDMRFHDKPRLTKAMAISDSFLYGTTDSKLFADMESLISKLSYGAYYTVARRMFEHFKLSRGGQFADELLNELVSQDVSFVEWCNYFFRKLSEWIKEEKGNVCNMKKKTIQRFSFDCFDHRWHGLGIMIHQVQAIDVELLEFEMNEKNGNYKGKVKIHLYDHFGLDKVDVEKGHARYTQPWGSEDGFKAWWILQHYRWCKPFLTHIEITKSFHSKSNN
ncbi:DUF3289 family protein [Chitinophagaceae bacterium 26-R-25]|nr:DUF3289 family protein [Chitinophagaceae bacterium 26-R-25]